MTKHNVLVVGSGGREHTLAWALSRSERVKQVYVAPGNAGTQWPENPSADGLQPRAPSQNVSVSTDDFPALIDFAREKNVSLTVVGPEAPLAAGIVDAFQEANLPIFGPTQAAAQLEASKAFAKDFMWEQGLATAAYTTFEDYEAARHHLDEVGAPIVVKASGLAAGKGVIVCETLEEARTALERIMRKREFGQAGEIVVIEEQLTGPEVSVLAFTDRRTVVPMPSARDHKRALDNDQGPNTGGMGAYVPDPETGWEQIDQIHRTILQSTVDGMAARGMPYVGVLYAGLIRTPDGQKILEFNCRFGDPETQVILPLLETDLFDVLSACVEGRLDEVAVCWKEGACATVVLASPGYPREYPKGLPISGLDNAAKHANVIVFHAGTAQQDGQVVTAGGRVLGVTALGEDLPIALNRAYESIEAIHFEGMHFRRDIGKHYLGGDA